MSTPAAHNQALGSRGESIAAAYLEERGFRIVQRNWRTRRGELDLIAVDSGVLVAVEVKTRSGAGYGHPFEAITARKALRLRQLLLEWARAHGSRARGLRVDAVGVVLRTDLEPCIEHLRGIS
ncbi:YraN family protein [Leucobacter triazinivorans]|nr:YraN family protein [Leucobacter triazinivorans]